MLKPQTDGHTSVYARTPAIGKCQGLFARLRFPYSEASNSRTFVNGLAESG